MVTRITKTVFDDVSNEPGAQTFTFGLGGQEYEIDLVSDELLRGALEPFIAVARKGGVAPRRGSRRANPGNAAIRAWAEAQGTVVLPRGKIPRVIVEAYNAAHPA